VRIDDRVGASGVCGEAYLGGDILTHIRALAAFRVEGGIGWTMGVTSGDRDYGTSTSSGGPYLAIRGLFDFDITQLFFVRVGPEVRGSFSPVAPGIYGVVDVGTRVGEHFELGLRSHIGAEGVVRSDSSTQYEWAPAWGVTAFAGPVF
jgi:hypothetical protein